MDIYMKEEEEEKDEEELCIKNCSVDRRYSLSLHTKKANQVIIGCYKPDILFSATHLV